MMPKGLEMNGKNWTKKRCSARRVGKGPASHPAETPCDGKHADKACESHGGDGGRGSRRSAEEKCRSIYETVVFLGC